MLIGYIGNYRETYCTEVHLAAELESLGHTVMRWQEPPGGKNGLAFVRDFEAWALNARPALVMFTRTWGLPPTLTRTWRRLEAAGIVTCSYHLDLYVGLHRQRGIANDPFWTTQHVFTPDGDPASAMFFRRRRINHHWSPPAVFSQECGRGEWDPDYDYPVVFVGSERYHEEWPWRGTLLRFLTERYGEDFRRFGGGTPEGATRGRDLNDLYATARVVVGDSLALPGHRNYWSDRYYETVGRGGFLIAPRVPGIEAHFEDGKHLRYYTIGDFDGIGRLIDKALADDIGSRRIAATGMMHVLQHHTYYHRLAEALDTMGLT